jgi:TonB family protein
LLKAWGDKARKRIRSQARNSEEGARGTVRFEFDVSRRGRLLDVRLTTSSGYNNLDNDALEATRAAFNEAWEIVPFPDDVSVGKWTFPMDLTYPLY